MNAEMARMFPDASSDAIGLVVHQHLVELPDHGELLVEFGLNKETGVWIRLGYGNKLVDVYVSTPFDTIDEFRLHVDVDEHGLGLYDIDLTPLFEEV